MKQIEKLYYSELSINFNRIAIACLHLMWHDLKKGTKCSIFHKKYTKNVQRNGGKENQIVAKKTYVMSNHNVCTNANTN